MLGSMITQATSSWAPLFVPLSEPVSPLPLSKLVEKLRCLVPGTSEVAAAEALLRHGQKLSAAAYELRTSKTL